MLGAVGFCGLTPSGIVDLHAKRSVCCCLPSGQDARPAAWDMCLLSPL